MFAPLATVTAGQPFAAIERFDEFRLDFSRELVAHEALSLAVKLLDALVLISSRDRFELEVEFADDPVGVNDVSTQSRQRLGAHLAAHGDDAGMASFRIRVIKTVHDGRLSIYAPEEFGSYLHTQPLPDVLTALSNRFNGRLAFECFAPVNRAGSATIRFVAPGEVTPDTEIVPQLRTHSLELFKDNSYSASLIGMLLPSDFALVQSTGLTLLDEFMDRACAVLSAMFLANSSELRGDQFIYRLAGYKMIEGVIAPLATLAGARKLLYRIVDWAYGSGGSSDKIGLARNVLSLYVNRLEEARDHPEIWNAIQSNYQIYLKANVVTYLEVRNKIAEFLVESTAKTHTLVEGLLDSIRNGMMVVFTFLLTVVVVNGLKDTGTQVIFSTEYLVIVVILSALSTLWLAASCWDAARRFDQTSKTTRELLKRSYEHVLIPKEIEEHVAPTITENRTYLVAQAKQYFWFWLATVALLVVAFWLGNRYLYHPPSAATLTSPKPPVPAKMSLAAPAKRGNSVLPIAQRPRPTNSASTPAPESVRTPNACTSKESACSRRQADGLNVPQ